MRTRIEADELVKAAVFYNGTRKRWAEAEERIGFKWGARFVKNIKDRYRTGGTTADRTAVRTGMLRRAYSFRLEHPRAGAVDIRVGAIKPTADDKALQYAATHEFGAHIVAKNGKFLAIPLKAALTSAGVPKGTPREFENTFVIRGEFGGEGIIAQRQASGEIVPLFKLKREVTIPARPSIRPTMEEFAPQVARDGLEALRQAAGGH